MDESELLIYEELLEEFDRKRCFKVEDRGAYFRGFSDKLLSQNRQKLISPLFAAGWESGVGYACSIIVQDLEKVLCDDEIIEHYLKNIDKIGGYFGNRYEIAVILPKVLQYKDFAVADALSTFLSKHEGEIDRRRNLLFEHFKGEKYGLFNQDPFSLYSGSLVDFYTGQFLAINKDLVECLTEEAGKVGETPFGVNISWFLPNLDKAMEIGIMHANKIDDESGGELAKKFIKHYFEFINNYAEQCSCLINHHNPNEHSFNERFLITFATKLKENLPCALSQRNIVDFLRSEVSTNEKSQERASIYLNYEF